MTTGGRIRERRKTLGIKAEALAKKLGLSRSTIFRYENGQIERVPAEFLKPLSEALYTTPAYLLGWTDEPDSGLIPINTQEIINDMRAQGGLPPVKDGSINPRLAILYSRSRALTDKQLDIVNSIVDEMVDEKNE